MLKNGFRQKIIDFADSHYYQTLTKTLIGCKSVLDVGCGSWSPLARVKKTFSSEGIDIHQPSLNQIKRLKIHDRYRLGDVTRLANFYQPKSFDAVVCLDLIEHLEKPAGEKLLRAMETIARRKVILLTPNGFTGQDPLKGNPHQVHRAGWRVADFRNRDYQVYGMRGAKFIRGGCATIRFKPWFLWGLLATLSQPLVYFFPNLAYQLLAVKRTA